MNPNRRETQVYNSDDDSGDDLFGTVPTQLLESVPPQRAAGPYITQPTQLLETTPPHRPKAASPTVQVAASSPIPDNARSPAAAVRPLHGGLVNRMAPPGTQFVNPASRPVQHNSQNGMSQPSQWPGQDMTQTLDESAVQIIDSSDEENPHDIKPATFEKSGGLDMQRYAFQQQSTSVPKRSADAMADAYASSRERPAKAARFQMPFSGNPSKQPIVDMTLQDIHDYDIRVKVEDMLKVFSGAFTVRQCYDALVKSKSNKNDAMTLLTEEEEKRSKRLSTTVDLTASDDELNTPTSATRRPTATAKQQVQNSKSISEKWGPALIKTAENNPEVDVMAILKRAENQVRSKQMLQKQTQPIAQKYAPSPTTAVPTAASSQPQTQKRRRLVQKGRATSPPQVSSPVQVPKASLPRRPKVLDSDEESEAEDDDDDSAVEVKDGGQAALERKLLEFINTAGQKDIMDVSSQSQEIVDTVVAARPFSNLDAVRAVIIESHSTTKTGKTKIAKRQVGARLVEVCLEMFEGYKAIDDLVAQCERMGKPVSDAMKHWGFNTSKNNSNGELDLLDLEASRDSGIGTPSSSAPSPRGDDDQSLEHRSTARLLKQPKIMSTEITLKDYQVVGLNWLALLFSNRLSGILADDMGLGKTCQVVSFLAHLYEIGQKGVHLVVVPGSTLENWLREFKTFCPGLTVAPYYGSQAERAELQENILHNKDHINVVVTTYDMATSKTDDSKFLRKLQPTCAIFDEGHALKNSNSKKYQALMRIPAEFRLLLTGTPLQNNLQELASLLAFLMPHVFNEHQESLQYIFKPRAKTTDDEHTALLSADRIARARSMMTPFILRRKKHQVLKQLPTKTCRVEYTELTPEQRELYKAYRAEAWEELNSTTAETEVKKTTKNAAANDPKKQKKATSMMKMRQVAMHPMLTRHKYSDETLREMAKVYQKANLDKDINVEFVFEDLSVMTDWELHRFCQSPDRGGPQMAKFALEGEPWLESGKVTALLATLRKWTEDGHRTLIFSQFTSMMDILEAVLESASIAFYRLDGSTPMKERQDMIDAYTADETPVFMLSTKAGGAGINLACADKVIIYDSSFNPQDDIQAENRAHRVGQTREVEVVRLVTPGTIEEAINILGNSKLLLDARVAGEDEGAGAAVETKGRRMVEDMLRKELEGDFGGTGAEKDYKPAPSSDMKDAFKSGLKKAGLVIDK